MAVWITEVNSAMVSVLTYQRTYWLISMGLSTYCTSTASTRNSAIMAISFFAPSCLSSTT